MITGETNLRIEVQRLLPEVVEKKKRDYWRQVLRMAALCHDVGHLPFSHAAEKQLLPEGWDHERLAIEIILSEEMQKIWKGMTFPLRAEDIAKLAVGPEKLKNLAGSYAINPNFSNWEAILSEIITGDVFGVDRMDYLLRDSHHLGVAYGRFDHYRLIDTMRILPSPSSGEPTLG